MRKGWIACVAVALGCLVAAPSAQAAFTVSGTASPSDPTSGANSNINIDINFGGGTSADESVKDLIVHLPPGWSATREPPRCARSPNSTPTTVRTTAS